MDIVDKILGLKELGYSREEIDKLISPPEIETIVIPQEEDKSAEETKDEEPTNERDDETNNRLKSIEDTLKEIQTHNIKWSNLPEQEEKTELELVQEILGGFSKNGNE